MVVRECDLHSRNAFILDVGQIFDRNGPRTIELLLNDSMALDQLPFTITFANLVIRHILSEYFL